MDTGQPSPLRARPGGPAPLLLRTEREDHAGPGRISVLKARGTVDAGNAGRLSAALAAHLAHAERAGEHPVLDLTEAHLACAAALRALDGPAAALARAGRALHVVQPRPHVRETLAAAGLPGIRTHATRTAALHALETETPSAPRRSSPRGRTGEPGTAQETVRAHPGSPL
ncbi:STAS domain-containing protein [Streptomyces sp. NPDC038707]|uniref:STAS domain-containing protein n=1 Tax=unclassified Streptomyces TaxID=2593676 RepID=UPI0033E35C94